MVPSLDLSNYKTVVGSSKEAPQVGCYSVSTTAATAHKNVFWEEDVMSTKTPKCSSSEM